MSPVRITWWMNIVFVLWNHSSVLAPEILLVKTPQNMWQASWVNPVTYFRKSFEFPSNSTGLLKSMHTAILSDGDLGLICISARWAWSWRLHLVCDQPLNPSVIKNHSESAVSSWRACQAREPNYYFVTCFQGPNFLLPVLLPLVRLLHFLGLLCFTVAHISSHQLRLFLGHIVPPQ